jgi:hypothetical protein
MDVADRLGTDSLRSIACPSATDCLAVDGYGNVLKTDQAQVATPPWRLLPTAAGRGLPLDCQTGGDTPCDAFEAVTCASTTLCVAVGDENTEVSVTNPFSAHPTSSKRGRPVLGPFSSVSCPSTSLCVALDAFGQGAVPTDPAATSPDWTSFDTGLNSGQEPDQ